MFPVPLQTAVLSDRLHLQSLPLFRGAELRLLFQGLLHDTRIFCGHFSLFLSRIPYTKIEVTLEGKKKKVQDCSLCIQLANCHDFMRSLLTPGIFLKTLDLGVIWIYQSSSIN